jgi:hypothetical protein
VNGNQSEELFDVGLAARCGIGRPGAENSVHKFRNRNGRERKIDWAIGLKNLVNKIGYREFLPFRCDDALESRTTPRMAGSMGSYGSR